jgi:hypothetical protein
MATVRIDEKLVWLPVSQPENSNLAIDMVNEGTTFEIECAPGEVIREIEVMKIPHDPRKANQTLMNITVPSGESRRSALYAYRAVIVTDNPVPVTFGSGDTNVDADAVRKGLMLCTEEKS